MRKIIAIVIICFLMCQPALAAENKVLATDDMEQVILKLLCEPMLDAIADYYGQPRLYWPDSDKVNSIRQVPDTSFFEVVVQVETFYGPHNPPFGIETMTFYVSCGKIELKKFEHQDKPV